RRRHRQDIFAAPSISVKLSALHPRYDHTHRDRVIAELTPKLLELALLARDNEMALTVDAEEADRLVLSLDVFARVLQDKSLGDWDGFGLAFQTYLKMAGGVIDYLTGLADQTGHRLPVRLVKGAYWDSEIKHAQVEGFPGYPVFTRKASTDVSFIACARRVLERRRAFYPQFATHNAHTIASVLEFAGNNRDFEFQRLHGMGEELYEEIVETGNVRTPCRIYAPVGEHEDLLAYLVRRLLENGANSSFVNRIQDEALPIDEIIADPVALARGHAYVPHPRIPLPRDIYGDKRRNFKGIDLTDRSTLIRLVAEMSNAERAPWVSAAIVAGKAVGENDRDAVSPADQARVIGRVRDAREEDVDAALTAAASAAKDWSNTAAEERAACLNRLADLMEQESAQLMAICVREAGKTLLDAVAEVREAVDFCRYYAIRAVSDCGSDVRLRVPARDDLKMRRVGGEVFCCISPWNFPLAIFSGQVTAALAAGNAVVAKPAEQTPIIAAAAVRLMHRAGIPADVLHLLPGDGATIGSRLVADPRTTGVCFTGSTEVAQIIHRVLARRDGPLAPLIAETGGQNAMIVDSSALPEQVTRDVIMSAFQSAGQRCSAQRVLFVQDDVADRMIEMIDGAMQELNVGDPALLSTDIGPVIDDEAKSMLEAHIRRMRGEAKLIRQVKPGPSSDNGHFVGPAAFEIDRLSRLQHEVFGPVPDSPSPPKGWT
ncbi:MAG TPA: bifunctional proline dehydrogenase/L-glutamate gamma-semialdehyde dehydrogenase PutA, partial [Xanthomonadales bacterium]|nr:bifunctional proline dehydrogenase/L-glutamate gamma-semialdehyde dehydrogenase PutA [Xanthomonadales bacterium]